MRRFVTHAQHGFTIIELLITLALFGVLLGLGIPAFTTFIQNAQIRNAAENAMTGINLAKAQAVQRNSTVRFQLVTNLTSGCTLSQASGTWIVSQDSAAGLCDVAPSETVAPRTIRKQSAEDGSPKVAVTATGGSSIVFNGLGRVVGTGISQIDINHNSLTCEHVDLVNGTARCLRILISTGGLAKLCDPKMSVTTDPRYCN